MNDVGGWAVGVGGTNAHVLESRLGGYLPHYLGDWATPAHFVYGTGTGFLAADPDVWTDGSLVQDEVSGVCSGGAGVFVPSSGACWFHRSWGHLDLLPPGDEPGSERSRLYLSVPRPLQTVQRAELWRVITALQAARPLGVDNANVVGHVGRIIDRKGLGGPFELLVDGDLLSLVKMLILALGAGSTAISKVKGHADEGLVRRGQVREADKFGNDMADEAADLGRHRVDPGIVAPRNAFACACRDWYPIVRDLHRFFIAISRAIVNDDGKGGTAPDPLV